MARHSRLFKADERRVVARLLKMKGSIVESKATNAVHHSQQVSRTFYPSYKCLGEWQASSYIMWRQTFTLVTGGLLESEGKQRI